MGIAASTSDGAASTSGGNGADSNGGNEAQGDAMTEEASTAGNSSEFTDLLVIILIAIAVAALLGIVLYVRPVECTICGDKAESNDQGSEIIKTGKMQHIRIPSDATAELTPIHSCQQHLSIEFDMSAHGLHDHHTLEDDDTFDRQISAHNAKSYRMSAFTNPDTNHSTTSGGERKSLQSNHSLNINMTNMRESASAMASQLDYVDSDSDSDSEGAFLVKDGRLSSAVEPQRVLTDHYSRQVSLKDDEMPTLDFSMTKILNQVSTTEGQECTTYEDVE